MQCPKSILKCISFLFLLSCLGSVAISNREIGSPLHDNSSEVTVNPLSNSVQASYNDTIEGPIIFTGNDWTDYNFVKGNGSMENPYIISNLIFTGNSDYGIFIQNSTAFSIIHNCSIQNSTYGIYLTESESCVITNNTFTGNSIAAIAGNCSENCNISKNYIHHNAGDGIYMYDSKRFIIQSNEIHYNEGVGINVRMNPSTFATYHEIFQNSVKYNTGGNILSNSWGYDYVYDNIEVEAISLTCNVHNQIIDLGEQIQFSVSLSGGEAPYSYNWDFGDGNSSTIAEPTHGFTTEGKFTVRITVADVNQISASASVKITVIDKTPQEDPKPSVPGFPLMMFSSISIGAIIFLRFTNN